jgi:ribosomal protein S18 acetylase RimI-like enzyme
VEIALDHAPSLEEIALLFQEYAASLGFPLDFQDFDRELDSLPGAYAPPRGLLLLARCDGEPAGCVALRPLETGAAEVKRLYVRDRCRGRGIGRLLATELIAAARRLGYSKLRLDTVPSMATAQALYRSLGFREIDAYTVNPIPGARFFELEL